jgi:putative oxidoreductase
MRRWLYPDSVSVLGSAGLLLLRVPVGLAFLVHGWPKIQNPFGWMGPEVSVPAILQFFAAVAEFGGGLLLIPGLLTRIAGAGVAATMVGAMVLYHIPVGSPFIGIPGRASYELVIVYLACGLLLFLSGAGRYRLIDSPSGYRLSPNRHRVTGSSCTGRGTSSAAASCRM